MYNYEWIL